MWGRVRVRVRQLTRPKREKSTITVKKSATHLGRVRVGARGSAS